MSFDLTRRAVLGALAATGLVGCTSGSNGGGSGATGSSWRAAPNAGFDAWLAGYRGRAEAAGLPASVVQRALSGAGYLPGVIERDRNQTEFRRTLEDYLAIAASDSRVRTGRQKLAQRSGTLGRIEARYGVPAHVTCAIWGLESRYGERRGDAPVISALATLAYDGRRGEFFERQLTAALRIIAAGDISASGMTGSWAGAMGHTQFIPTSYLSLAVDFDGDGRRDIWGDDPTDALASAANYLSRNGWQKGVPWGAEVILPGGYSGPFGRSNRQSAGALQAAGVRRADGGAMSQLQSAGIIVPAGQNGPAFAVTRNFGVILTYNRSENYAIGIGHLSDRIAGGGPLRASFGPDDSGLTLEDRKALQRGLTAAGFDAGEPDGVIGGKTRDAIRAFQRARGLSVTGEPSRGLLDALS